MSDTFTDDEPELDDDGNPVEPKPDKGERNAEKLRKARLTEAELRKELAFAKAGVDIDSTFGKYLLSTFQGEATAEAIKAHTATARSELGLPDPADKPAQGEEAKGEEPTKPGPEITPETAASTQERRALTSEGGGDSADGLPDVPPGVKAQQAYKAVMASGGTSDAAGAAAARALREAAEGGDARAVYDPTAAR